MHISSIYVNSIFQDFKSVLTTEVDLVEDDVRLVLDEYNSWFITFQLEPGIYTSKDLPESVFIIFQPEYPTSNNVIVNQFDDISMKTKLVERSGIIAIRFVKKSFLNTILGFTPHWGYKHYNE